MVEFERLKLEKAYESVLVEAYKDYLKMPDGNTVVYDLLHHKTGGGAGVLLVDEEGYTYLVRLFRNSINRATLEIPAGGYSSPDESGEVCCVREAEEETGWIPTKLHHITNMVSSIGTYDEMTDVFIGTCLKKGERKLDPAEFIEVERMKIEDAFSLVKSGEIVDSKTILAIYAYLFMKQNGEV